MQILSLLFSLLSLLALIHCMPQQDAGAVQLMRRDDPPEVPQGYKMAMATLPGQRRIITLYRNGTCEGTLIEGMNGTVTAYDADGNFLNLNGHDLDRRGLFSALKKLGKWVAKTGKKAWNFVGCVSGELIQDCGDSTVNCVVNPQPTFECLGGLVCGGKQFADCL